MNVETEYLLDPKNDFVFKRIFSDAPELLCELINAVREDHPAILDLEVLNPTIDSQELSGKYIILDLQVSDVEGKRYNIEMQVRKYNAWSARSAYYMARMLTQQLSKGEDYQSIKPAIGIHLLDFELFDQKDQQKQAQWCFEMRDKISPEIRLGEELQLNIIELPKADRLGLAQDKLAAWVTFFEHWYEEFTMANIAYQPVQDALQKVRALSADSETRHLAFVRERALHDEVSQLNAAKQEGVEQGRSEEKQAFFLKMLMLKFTDLPDGLEQKLAKADDEQLDIWSDKLFQASSLEDIFE